MVELADRQLAHYNEMYVPIEYQQMADVNRYRSDTFKQGSKDKSVNAARMNTSASMVAGAGMNPGTKSMATEQQSGSASALGAMAGLQSAEDLYAQGALNTVVTGQKQQGTQLSLASTMAQQQADVIAARKAADQQVNDSYWGAAGSIAGGVAAGYYGKSKNPTKKEVVERDKSGMWVHY